MPQNRMLHPDPAKVYACPECNSSNIYKRATDGTYRCEDCGLIFEEDPGVRRSGMAADPDSDFPNLTHEDGNMVYACPECDASSPVERVRETPRFRCNSSDCDAEFDEPVERERKDSGKGSTLEQALRNGDVPEELLESPLED